MYEKLGLATYDEPPTTFLPGMVTSARQYSEETSREIDCAVRDILKRAADSARSILEYNRDALEHAPACCSRARPSAPPIFLPSNVPRCLRRRAPACTPAVQTDTARDPTSRLSARRIA
jgi:hypothetical protein